MFDTRKVARAAVAGALLTASLAAFAQVGESVQVEGVLVQRYTSFAGSQPNAIALVDGLRNGTQVTLQPVAPGCAPAPVPVPPAPPGLPGGIPGGPQIPGGFPPPPPPPAPAPVPPATFTPPTGTMGYGNVNIAMDLAEQQLARTGLPKPYTPQQIQASFMGGTVSSCAGVKTVLQGILVLRADKAGWGRIASQLGLAFSDGN